MSKTADLCAELTATLHGTNLALRVVHESGEGYAVIPDGRVSTASAVGITSAPAWRAWYMTANEVRNVVGAIVWGYDYAHEYAR